MNRPQHRARPHRACPDGGSDWQVKEPAGLIHLPHPASPGSYAVASKAAGARKRHCAAFTLIELLTVVAILALLVGLLFPAANLVRQSAKRRQAQQQAQALVQAVKEYRLAYGKWPGQSQDATDFVGTVCTALLGELTNNPRNTPFLGSLDGMVTNNSFLDPWGRAYIVALDENGDGSITNIGDAFAPALATNVRDSAAVASWGPDTHNAEKRVYSWEPK